MQSVKPRVALLIATTSLLLIPSVAPGQALTSERLSGLDFRLIGPAGTGGRIHDVEALPGDPSTLFVATASGGIWKSLNAGTTWAPVFEGQPVSTFGDLAIAPSDPRVVWAGTGEQNNRQSTSWGNGVYRSTDGGESWTHRGLEGTRHIGRVVVHPRDPDIAYVAALGNLWSASPDRGVYRTTDGGARWEKVLFVDTLTGAVDLVMDPSNPDVLYAATYQRQRRAWGFNGGGPGSGIYKTTDGGRTWRELTNGIPAGDKGRIGLAIARTNPRILNATIEHGEEGGTYRSEDGGESWTRVNRLNPRPMYYSHIVIDPTNENRVYILATDFFKSEDGGRSFEQLPTNPTYDVGIHADYHTMWIDPRDPEHFYLAGDGGLFTTWDMGRTYRKIDNLPIGQFYAIGADDRDPYWVYGGMQDNHSWMGPSATRHWIGIINDDWWQIGFGDGMYQQVDLDGHRFVYTTAQNGNLTRLDAETGDLLGIEPTAPGGEALRYDWVTPILASRHTPGTVYVGANRLMISRDHGRSWHATEDLTRRIDRDTLSIMGVRGADIRLSRNDGTESYGEIVTVSESPLDPAILWVGTDDGNLQVSRDGGRSWTEVSRNLPVRGGPGGGMYVSRVAASAAGPGVAYATLDNHRNGDFAPYVFRTRDFGRTWTPLHDELPSGSVNEIVEHPADPNLLFLGTEHALWVSADAGDHWARFPGLPTTLYDDVLVQPRENDLVVGTHGRSIWILDDLTPLVEWEPAIASAAAHLFPVQPATIFQYWKDTSYRGQAAYAGENPPHGAILNYHLGRPAGEVTIRVTGPDGRVVRTLTGPGTAGVLHRVVWDLRHEPPPSDDDEEEENPAVAALPHPVGPRGPFVSPGTYTVTLESGGATESRTVEVRGDPRMPLTVAQHREREAFLLEVADLQRRVALALRGDPENRVLQSLGRRLWGLASEFNGGGVRQGSLHPPTATHRERKAALEAEVARVIPGG